MKVNEKECSQNSQISQRYFKSMLYFTMRTLRFIKMKLKFSVNETKSIQNKPPKILPTVCINRQM